MPQPDNLQHCYSWVVPSAHASDLLRPELGRKVRGEQGRQKQRHDAHTRFREFAVGDKVMIRDGRDKSQWRPGTVMEQRGPVSYQVQW